MPCTEASIENASGSQTSFNYGNVLENADPSLTPAPAPSPAPVPLPASAPAAPIRSSASAVYRTTGSKSSSSAVPVPLNTLDGGDIPVPAPCDNAQKLQTGKRPISPKTRARMEENKKKALRLQAEHKAQAVPERLSTLLCTGKGQSVTVDTKSLNKAEQILR